MNLQIPLFSLRSFTNNQTLAVSYLVVMCVQIVPLEGYVVSPIKIGLMVLAPILFIFNTPYVSKALIWGIAYYGMCYFYAVFNGDMRFSTIAYWECLSFPLSCHIGVLTFKISQIY